MTELESNLLRLVWLLVESQGGHVRVLRSALEGYPGDAKAVVAQGTDPATGDMVLDSTRAEPVNDREVATWVKIARAKTANHVNEGVDSGKDSA